MGCDATDFLVGFHSLNQIFKRGEKSMKRILSALVSLAVILVTLSGCSSKPTNIRILCIENSPASVITDMITNNDTGKSGVNYVISTVNLASRVQSLMLDDECDVAILPIETAQAIYRKKSVSIQVLAGISVGGFELITSENISALSEIKGKEIFLTERGTLMEKIFKHLIKLNGLNPNEDITLNYASDATQLSNQFAKKEVSFALVKSEDAALVKAQNEYINSYNITDELSKKLKKPSIVTYCVIAKKDFIESNQKEIDVMITDIQNSVTSVKDDRKKAGKSAKEQNLITLDVDTEILLNEFKPDFIAGEDMQKKFTAYFNFLTNVDSSLSEKSIPDDSFYYITEE